MYNQISNLTACGLLYVLILEIILKRLSLSKSHYFCDCFLLYLLFPECARVPDLKWRRSHKIVWDNVWTYYPRFLEEVEWLDTTILDHLGYIFYL